jgi:hypothetical protein
MTPAELLKSADESHSQIGLGMMRVAELQAISNVAGFTQTAAYVSMGCGRGYDFLALRENIRNIPAIGFDIGAVLPENVYPEVEFHNEPIFEPDRYVFRDRVHEKIYDFLDRHPGPRLFYTDNGRKLEELRELLSYARRGDVIGTHDWGVEALTPVNTYAEVIERECSFIYEAGFGVLEEIEPWIVKHQCLQRFWLKR